MFLVTLSYVLKCDKIFHLLFEIKIMNKLEEASSLTLFLFQDGPDVDPILTGS
jgi:hypothetical protein